jgi:hypothetical protein
MSPIVIPYEVKESVQADASQRGNRCLARVVTHWQKGRKAAALGLEPSNAQR